LGSDFLLVNGGAVIAILASGLLGADDGGFHMMETVVDGSLPLDLYFGLGSDHGDL
jgi:hypothetical protein